MDIIIETPKYSFFKYQEKAGRFYKVFISPIPIIFNYGFISGTCAQDGMARDVIIFGPRMRQGTVIKKYDDYKFDGVVRFVDDGLIDDKNIIYVSGFCNTFFLSMYFRVYALYKTVLYLVSKRKIVKCRFNGIEWNL